MPEPTTTEGNGAGPEGTEAPLTGRRGRAHPPVPMRRETVKVTALPWVEEVRVRPAASGARTLGHAAG
jgi:hypothetical protein